MALEPEPPGWQMISVLNGYHLSSKESDIRQLVRIIRTVIAVGLILSQFNCGPGSAGDPATFATTTTHEPDSEASLHGDQYTSVSHSSIQGGARSAQPVRIPMWMTQALASPDVQARLAGLETWVRRNGRGAIDPLMLASNDPDERVRNRALQLIGEDWIAEQALLSK